MGKQELVAQTQLGQVAKREQIHLLLLITVELVELRVTPAALAQVLAAALHPYFTFQVVDMLSLLERADHPVEITLRLQMMQPALPQYRHPSRPVPAEMLQDLPVQMRRLQ